MSDELDDEQTAAIEAAMQILAVYRQEPAAAVAEAEQVLKSHGLTLEALRKHPGVPLYLAALMSDMQLQPPRFNYRCTECGEWHPSPDNPPAQEPPCPDKGA